jgi:hypothetical protein
MNITQSSKKKQKKNGDFGSSSPSLNPQALQRSPASDPSAFSPSSSGDKFYLSKKHKSVKKKKKKSKHSKNRNEA